VDVVLALTTQTATLIAAAIGAAAGVVKLVADALSARGAASRAAHRSVLEPHLARLATSIHEVVAGAVLIHRGAQKNKVPGNALASSQRAAADLKQQRLAVKYPLPGLEEPLRTLTRAPDWAATFDGHASGDRFIACLQELGRRIDKTIERSYRRGRPPARWESWRLARQTGEVRDAWDTRFGRVPDARTRVSDPGAEGRTDGPTGSDGDTSRDAEHP
jgi:hypothetical protein